MLNIETVKTKNKKRYYDNETEEEVSRFKIDQSKKSEVGLEIESIADLNDGIITKELIVEKAHDESTALHTVFENNGLFDPETAMKRAQNDFAGLLIRTYKVWVKVKDGDDVKTRGIVNIVNENNERTFMKLDYVMAHEQYRKKLLEIAMKELLSFKKKYALLTELADLFKAIDRTVNIA